MKFSTRIIAILLCVLMVLSVGIIGIVSVISADAATAQLTYSFANVNQGFAQGTINLTPDSGSYGTYYLYWADDNCALKDYREIAKLTINSGTGTVTMPKYTAIPTDATKLIAIKSETVPADRTVSNATSVYTIPENKLLPYDTEDALYTFGSISDPQLANDSYGSNSYPYDEDHLKAALETLHKRGVDFTVSSGDTVNDQDGNRTYKAEYRSYQQILADSSYAKPVYEANGNHDVGTVWNKNGNYYNDNAPFIKATGLDSKAETINNGLPYFEVTEPTTGDHFIFMALEGGFYTNKGTQFSKAQLDWLEGLLKKYNNDGKKTFIIEHANIAGWGSGDKLTAPYYYDLALIKSNADVKRFIGLMETYKDCVIITGHTHLELSAQYNYCDNNGTSAVMMHNSAIGGVRRLVNGKVDRTAVLGMSEGYIVEVYEDYILFNGTNMYYNETMPQCCYIIPTDKTQNDIVTSPEEYTTTSENEIAPDYADVYLSGGFNSWGQQDAFLKTDNENIVTRTLELSAGTYEFKIIEGSTWLGNSGTIEDTTTSTSKGGWEMTSGTGNCTLSATGGSYTFNFNTSTNKLIVLHNQTYSLKSVAESGNNLYKFGDADLNGTVNVKDATAIQKHAASLITLEGTALVQAEVTADGTVNIKDATAIQKFVASLIDKFPAEQTVPPTTTNTEEPEPTSETTTTDKPSVNNPAIYEKAKDTLSKYFNYSSYDQYMALKHEYKYGNNTETLAASDSQFISFVDSVSGDAAPEELGEIDIYFTNSKNWSKVYAYVWGSAGNGPAWPGVEMTSLGNNNYKITVDVRNYQNIIFTNNSGEQTEDIVIVEKNNQIYRITGGPTNKYTCTAQDFS